MADLSDLVIDWVNKNKAKLGPTKEFAGKTIIFNIRPYGKGVKIEASVIKEVFALESVYE